MRHIFKRLSVMLSLVMAPGFAGAEIVAPLADLPSGITAGGPDYRAKPLVEHLARATPRPTAMVERLFAPMRALGVSDRRHDAVLAIGGVEILAEAMRQRVMIATGAGLRGQRALDRVSMAGIKAAWPLGDADELSLGLAADVSKHAEPTILAGHRSIDGEGLAADCSWAHGAHWRMSIDWRADRSSSSSRLNRMLELAQGAAPSARGLRLTLSYLLAGAAAARGTTVGIAARDARIAADDLAAMGGADRQDVQTALFLRTSF